LTITAWRITRATQGATAFSGHGARRFGGRWNSKGTAIVYTASSQALAVLEMLVHLDDSDLLKVYRLIPVTFDDAAVTVLDPKTLPVGWNRGLVPASVRAIGDAWVTSQQSVALRVPSVVVPGENNFLLNIAHPDFTKLIIGKPQSYRFDPRLR
jgi:RES domain-containing protein